MVTSTEPGYIQFGSANSIEKYLENCCGHELRYLKEKGLLRAIATDFANESISTEMDDLPFLNKLTHLSISPDSGFDHSQTTEQTHAIRLILIQYLKGYRIELQDQKTARNRCHYVVLAVVGVALATFATYYTRFDHHQGF